MKFSVQYALSSGEHRLVDVAHANNERQLVALLALFDHPIAAVYEGGTVVTKRTRNQLAAWPGKMTRYALDFAFKGPR